MSSSLRATRTSGPLLNEQLRPYCPKKYLEPFDDFADALRRVGHAAQ